MLERTFFVEAGVAKSGALDYLLAMKHDARVTTLQYIKGITQEELDWQPFKGWNTVGALLAHIIAGEKYFRIVFIEGRELNEQESKEILPGLDLGEYVDSLKGKPLNYYLEQLETEYNESRKMIKNIDAAGFVKRRFEHYDKVRGEDWAWILYHDVEDEVHHRGQISIIRKLYKEMKGKQQ